MQFPTEIADKIERSKTFIISAHIQPDGDGIGSSLALMLALSKMGKSAKVVLSDDISIPNNLSFLPHFSDIKLAKDLEEKEIDCGIVLDAGTFDRIGNVSELMTKVAKDIINIDHHVTNDSFGNLNWIESEASSTGEMIYEVIKALGVELDKEIATCLFTAICTDTGSFSYSNTTDLTFGIASELVKAGAEPAVINQEIYESRSYSSLAALSECILNMKFISGGLGAMIVVSQNIMKKYGLVEGDVDNFIGYARSLDGVEVACNLREISEDKVRVGLRSKRVVDVAELALKLGGGGHMRASGCILNMPLAEAIPTMILAIENAITEAGLLWME